MGRDRPSRHVDDGRGQLTRDLEHVREHEEQPLRGGEGRRQRPLLQGAVERPCCATLALHLDDPGHRPPEVRLARR